ncbi:Dipeptidylaminopeptidase/acylaminoacyl-peptidase -like protein [Desulfocurvibacter africanus subsp. africanus str. Walvis Bay]|uniref:Dipeptidylaminopeptidase/acylaminoacyl-peptidase-like protein n=1 Tax=Desulfocurvibacter africanus subsp. africanus str. Walvis Bay TaxID=690850 RepID=F3Z2W0_DESAF|nr:Dipeptidylaminopeptidase/acylaminoacyl-peptidase -like protein [Desulfocurvibacter africanus subsp. africanus str. Walvis Bay]
METLAESEPGAIVKRKLVSSTWLRLAVVFCLILPCSELRLGLAAGFKPSEALGTFSDLPERLSWEKDAPQVRTIRITSTSDGTQQQALFYDPGSKTKRPLLVALHSWSDDYTQKASIPYALWSVQNRWVFIHPDFRGVNNKPQATASKHAIQDIIDALRYAQNNANVDESRIYLIGFSGGAMSALVMAGKYPELWTAVSAWVPVYDLNDWFRYNQEFQPTRHYVSHITASCGGVPSPGSKAAKDCARRSPSAYLKEARGKGVRIQIAVGVNDDYVPPSHSLRAFNDLAAAKDVFSKQDMLFIDKQGRLPSRLLDSRTAEADSRHEWPKIFERTSQNATLVLFEGKHDIFYDVGLDWLSQQVGPTIHPGH